MRQALLIIAWCLLAAAAYGFVQALVMGYSCPEYFRFGHPRIVRTRNPFVWAGIWGPAWGVWVGVVLAAPMALAARVGRHEPWDVSRLFRPTLALAGLTLCAAMIALVAGYAFGQAGIVGLPGRFAETVPRMARDRFLGCLFAHGTAYAGGLIGGVALAVWVRQQRAREYGAHAY